MKTIGVLGGMGPAAGADFYVRVVRGHGAPRDQDHPPCILYSATQIPDRTAFLLGDGPDPEPELQAAARFLESAAADFIVIPCNSAHAFLAAIRDAVSIPVIDMIGLAAEAVDTRAAGAERVGIMAANGAARVGLYDAHVRASGREPLYPAEPVQDGLMAAIREIKSGAWPAADNEPTTAGEGDSASAKSRLLAAADHLVERGAECLIMGCTEIPLALDPTDCPAPAIDANQVLVDTTLALATGRIDLDDVAATRPAGA